MKIEEELIIFKDILVGNNKYPLILEKDRWKYFASESCSYIFNKETGYTITTGKTLGEDPDYCPEGPMIADIEISTICNGINNKPCKWCYKNNTGVGHNMSFETFKKVFHNLPRTLTQAAFGSGDIDANPDIWKIFNYCRNNKYNEVIPNVTINGTRLTPEILDKLASVCGAVAVSRYNPSDVCYNAVKELTDRGMKQINIHMLLSAETYEQCIQTIKDATTDPRLSKLKAIVFLALKPKGRGKCMTTLGDPEKYKQLVHFALDKGVGIGFDSCSAPLFLKAMKDNPNYKRYEQLAEPCESYLFSIYINEKGLTFPCSFLEDEDFEGIDLTKENLNFSDIWNGNRVKKWRENLIATANHANCLVKGCRECPRYNIY